MEPTAQTTESKDKQVHQISQQTKLSTVTKGMLGTKKNKRAYLSTVSPLLRSGASIEETVGYVLMPGTPRRTVVGGDFA